MSAICRKADIHLIVAFIPTKWRVYRDLCTFEPGAICTRWAVNDLPRVLDEVIREIGDVEFLDLTRPFVDEAKRGALLYLPDDTHWSAEGHRVAALAVARALQTPSAADGPRHRDRLVGQGPR
jgi:hypothetical protein